MSVERDINGGGDEASQEEHRDELWQMKNPRRVYGHREVRHKECRGDMDENGFCVKCGDAVYSHNYEPKPRCKWCGDYLNERDECSRCEALPLSDKDLDDLEKEITNGVHSR